MNGALTGTRSPTQQGADGDGLGGVILLYHRVTRLAFDPQLLSVTPEHFAEHIEVLSRLAHPMSLRDMTQRLEAGSPLGGGIVVTFDDGYADNLMEAAPLLERSGVPATIFVASGYVGGDREFWWDELERVLFSAGSLPDVLRLEFGVEAFCFELDDTRHASVQASADWDVTASHDPTCRHRLYRALFDLLRPMNHEARGSALAALAEWSGVPRHVRDSHRPMSREELVLLNSHSLIEIGAHTVTHPQLSALTAPQQVEEITNSKCELEEIIGEAVPSFSYPYGTRHDYTNDAVRAVRDARFRRACSNVSGHVTSRVDRFQLPRMLVRDWDGETFLRKLAEIGVGV